MDQTMPSFSAPPSDMLIVSVSAAYTNTTVSPAFSSTSPASVISPLPRITLRVRSSAILTFNTGKMPVISSVTTGEVLRTLKEGYTPAPNWTLRAATVV